MKILLALIISLNTYAGLAPTTLSGQSATTKPTTFNFKTPYSQSTSLGGVNSLIETGNENMLVNPSFEGTTILPWTCAVGTCTVDTTVFSSGKQALKIVPAANIFTLNQEITTPANIQKQGAIGVIYNFPATCLVARVQTSIDGTLANTVSGSSLIYDGQFHTIEIPTVFGSSLAAISVNTDTGTCTGNIYVDAAYIKQGLGLTNLFQDAEYRAKVSNTGVVSDEDRDFISGNCTNAFPSVCTFVTGVFTVAPNCTALINGGANRVMTTSAIPTASSVSVYWMDSNVGTANAQPFTLSCKKSGNDYLNSSTQVYQSTNGDFGWTSYTPTSPNSSLTISATEAFYKREGDDLLVKFKAARSGGTAGEAQISLPSGLTSAGTDKIPTQQLAGIWTKGIADSHKGGFVFIEPSKTYFVFGNEITIGGTSISADTKALGTQVTGTPLYFTARIPIQGWTNSNVTVGSFAGVPSVPGYQGNVDTFSVSYGTTNATTVCSASPCSYLDQIGSSVTNITRVIAGQYSLNTVKTYSKLKCTFNMLGATAVMPDGASCSNCNSLTFSSYNLSSVRIDSFGTIDCKGSY